MWQPEQSKDGYHNYQHLDDLIVESKNNMCANVVCLRSLIDKKCHEPLRLLQGKTISPGLGPDFHWRFHLTSLERYREGQ